jgi:hypothetical protein
MAIILNSNGVRGNFTTVSNIGLKTESSIRIPDLLKGYPFDYYVAQVKNLIASELVNNGLYEAEALAMVNTWEKSYFQTPGIRVLYIVPNNTTESILPLAVVPAPVELKRVLVGRVEIMSKNQEIAYLKTIQEGTIPQEVLSRFSEPKLRRLEKLAPEGLKSFIRRFIN